MPFTPSQQKEFWRQYDRFLKTNLITETPHPSTNNLSKMCHDNLNEALSIFKQVELDALFSLFQYLEHIPSLHNDIIDCFKQKRKLFILGCGASGRLAHLLKHLYYNYNPNTFNQIICVIAAGDIALIKSIEKFEDHGEYGVQQLLQQGYTSNDLVVGLSASGESPFILDTISYVATHSQTYKPYLICNNKVEDLLSRNKNHVASNNKIATIALDVGPMALTGSTRLQATTAMQFVLGTALCININDINTNGDYLKQLRRYLKTLISTIKALPIQQLAKVTSSESNILLQGEYILYQTNSELLALNLLADLTERAPTFNLPPFENQLTVNKQQNLSPFYLALEFAQNQKDAWQTLLGQHPNCLNWSEFTETSSNYISGFDLSINSERAKGQYLGKTQHKVRWYVVNHQLQIYYTDSLHIAINLPKDHLMQAIIFKLYLNAHSTIMMGKLGYFHGNIMHSLKPSNFKLIDRAIRYSQFNLRTKYHIDLDYQTIAKTAFDQIARLKPNESIVENIVTVISRQQTLPN